MANKNKNVKEQLYLTPDGTKWRFIREEGIYWIMTRVKDGHHSWLPPEKLTLIRN